MTPDETGRKEIDMLTQQFLTIKDLCSETGFTSAGLYLQMRNGVFPRPLKLASKVSRWRADEVQKVFDAWSQHKSKDEIKAIVAALQSQQGLPPLPPPKTKTKTKQPQQDTQEQEGGAA